MQLLKNARGLVKTYKVEESAKGILFSGFVCFTNALLHINSVTHCMLFNNTIYGFSLLHQKMPQFDPYHLLAQCRDAWELCYQFFVGNTLFFPLKTFIWYSMGVQYLHLNGISSYWVKKCFRIGNT